jgi:hypothetical protein
MGGLVFWILALVLVVLVIVGLKNKIANSPNAVVTGPGVLKVHNVECRFWSERSGERVYHGKLAQDRWTDGQERFSLRLNKLPAHNGKVPLYRADALVSEFEAKGTSAKFAWKGISDDSIPKFDIGEPLLIVCGSEKLTGTVEAD